MIVCIIVKAGRITVEEMKNLGVENLEHMFLEIYTKQAADGKEPRNTGKMDGENVCDIRNLSEFNVMSTCSKIGRNMESELHVILSGLKV